MTAKKKRQINKWDFLLWKLRKTCSLYSSFKDLQCIIAFKKSETLQLILTFKNYFAFSSCADSRHAATFVNT